MCGDMKATTCVSALIYQAAVYTCRQSRTRPGTASMLCKMETQQCHCTLRMQAQSSARATVMQESTPTRGYMQGRDRSRTDLRMPEMLNAFAGVLQE